MTGDQLQQCYLLFNQELFDGELPFIEVRFDSDVEPAGGFWDPWLRRIVISPKRSLVETLWNLLHETVHVWQFSYGTLSEGDHDEEFNRKMCELGLIPPDSTGTGEHTLVEGSPFDQLCRKILVRHETTIPLEV